MVVVDIRVAYSERLRDADNANKGCLDILHRMGVIDGDDKKTVWGVLSFWSHELKSGVRITISPAREETKRRAA